MEERSCFQKLFSWHYIIFLSSCFHSWKSSRVPVPFRVQQERLPRRKQREKCNAKAFEQDSCLHSQPLVSEDTLLEKSKAGHVIKTHASGYPPFISSFSFCCLSGFQQKVKLEENEWCPEAEALKR